MKFKLLLVGFLTFCAMGTFAYAQEIMQDKQEIILAKVLEITSQEMRPVPGTGTQTEYQHLTAEILDGENEGKVVIVENDYLHLNKGDKFYLKHVTPADGGLEGYYVHDAYRLPAIGWFVALFVIATLLIGHKQGARGLVSLSLSIGAIFFLLLPALLHGWPPIPTGIGVAGLIIILGSYITHGYNRTTSAAVFGMLLALLSTGGLAFLAIHVGHLTGTETEEAVYLHFNTFGKIDLAGLLFAGIIIGLLGVLYDIAIAQAIAVEELHHAGPELSRRKVFTRALRMGREHIGALVNTLAIAYIGPALPLVLLYYGSDFGKDAIINGENFATEIFRITIGGIGLIIAVPITTWIAVIMKVPTSGPTDPSSNFAKGPEKS